MASDLVHEVKRLLQQPPGVFMDSTVTELLPGKVLRAYSSSLNLAWEYLAQPQFFYVLKNIQLGDGGRWVPWCSLTNSELNTWGEAWADTMPLAICRAFIVMHYSKRTGLHRAIDYEAARD